MKLIKVHTSKTQGYHDNLKVNLQEIVPIATLSWYEKSGFWWSFALSVASILSLIQQYHPTFAWAGLAAGIINAIVNLRQEVISPQSIVTS